MKFLHEYTLCFVFNEDMSEVILILKNRPVWQIGLYNGVGGKLKNNETPYKGVIREAYEEIGIKLESVEKIDIITDSFSYFVHCYFSVVNKRDNPIVNKTSESAKWFPVNKLPEKSVSNVIDLIGKVLYTNRT